MLARHSISTKSLATSVIVSLVALSCSARSCIEERRPGSAGNVHSKLTHSNRPKNACYRVAPQPDTVSLRKRVKETISWRDPTAKDNPEKRLSVKLLGFNDFHGQISGDVNVDGRRAGGAAVLTAYFKEAMAGMEDATVILHAGDLAGASPPPSALHQDEPSVAFFNLLANEHCNGQASATTDCNVVAAIGNHALDEGVEEMKRLVFGGDFARGPFLETPYGGARFPVLGANVVDAVTASPVLPPYTIVTVRGTPIGFVGAMLQGAARYLMPSGISGIQFDPAGPRIQSAVDALKAKGVRAIVLLMHDGGYQRFPALASCGSIQASGPIVNLIRTLDGEVDVVVSGHTHSPLNIYIPNRDGHPTLVTQAFSAGTAFADIDIEIDPASGEIVGSSSGIVTTWVDDGPGQTPDPRVEIMATEAAAAVRSRTEKVITETTAGIKRAPTPHGQSALGNLIADAQRTVSKTDFAFVNPSWVRTDLAAGKVTWGDLFAVQPFGNRLILLEMTGRQVMTLLKQQRISPDHSRTLFVSGLSYTWDAGRPEGKRIVSVTVQGAPLDPNGIYSVAVNAFLANGGEDFPVFKKAKRRREGMLDIDALTKYLTHLGKPLTPTLDDRIRRLP